MSEKISPEKKCENCQYYVAHYAKLNTSYFYIHNGHCINLNHRARQKKHEPVLCEYWEDIIIKKEDRKRGIKEAIILMSERLDELTMILKDDNEN